MGVLSQAASALFPSGASAPAVRKLVFEAQFGSGSKDDWTQALVAFSVEAGLAPFADVAEVRLATDRGPSCAPGDLGSLSAGFQDAASELLFTGQVDALRRGLAGMTRVLAVNGGALLSRLRVNQAYAQVTAGSIASDLAQQAGVDVDTTEDGATYAYYVIDDGRSAWQHIAELARKNGFLAWISAEGKLLFQPAVTGAPVQTFTYAQDILALNVMEATSPAGQVTVTGEGAAGSSGQDAWSWLVKDVSGVLAQAGSGDPRRIVSDGSLRSSDSAQKAADGIAAALQAEARSGWMLVPGAPAVTPGSSVQLEGVPQSDLNGEYLILRVQHKFDSSQGFTTLVYFTQSSQGGGAGPGGLGGLVGAVKGAL